MKGKRFISSVLAVMTFWLSSGASALPVPVMALGDVNDEAAEFTLGTSLNDEVFIDEVNFPDSTFRSYVSKNFDTDKSGGLSPAELDAVTDIEVAGTYENPNTIADLTGIEYFTKLTRINCNFNMLTSIDVSSNSALECLICGVNDISNLDVSKNTSLTHLFCWNNPITSLDISSNTALQALDCSNNQLTDIDISKNPALINLWCYNNMITNLDVSNNIALRILDCKNNQLSYIDLSNNTALTNFSCVNNTYSIGAVDGSYCLDKLPAGFDPKKASNWQGAYYDGSSNTLRYFTSDKVTYDYDCGNGNVKQFMLVWEPSALYTVTFPKGMRVKSDISGFIQSGDSVPSGTRIYIGMDLNSYKDHKVMVNGVEKTLTPNGDVYYCYIYPFMTASENIEVTLEDSPWTDEQLAAYTVLNADEGIRVYWYNEYYGSIPITEPIENGSIIPKGKTVCIKISSELYPKMPKMYINGQFQSSYLNNDGDWQVRGRYAPYESEFRIKIDGMVSEEPVAEINESTFPDSSFREMIISECDLNKDNKLSEDEILRVSYLNVSGTDENPGDIESLKGIEYFTELVYLECYNNKISYLDVSGFPKLYLLSCGNNKLTSLDVSKNPNLGQLYCSDNLLTEIDVTNNRYLERFACAANQISALDLSRNTYLTWLYCSANKLTTLDLGNNTRLETLGINGNNLTSLDLSNNTKLKDYEDNDNSYEIAVTGDSFKLSDLPAGFDASKAADWQGAEYDSATNSLKNFTGDTVTYNYSCGNGHSIKFTLVIAGGNSINITVQPANTSVIEGLDASFSVTAEGEDLTYQWQKLTGDSWVDINGETSSVLKLKNVTYDLNGTEYRCVVTAADESVTSGEAVLTVKAAENVSAAEVDSMSTDEAIKFVNAFCARYDKAGKDTAVLTSAQMTAIEKVLENDYKG